MNFVGVADEGPAAASGTKNVFSEFPGENPAQAELNAWLDRRMAGRIVALKS